MEPHVALRNHIVVERGERLDAPVPFTLGIEGRHPHRVLQQALLVPHLQPGLAILVLDRSNRPDRSVPGRVKGLLFQPCNGHHLPSSIDQRVCKNMHHTPPPRYFHPRAVYALSTIQLTVPHRCLLPPDCSGRPPCSILPAC